MSEDVLCYLFLTWADCVLSLGSLFYANWLFVNLLYNQFLLWCGHYTIKYSHILLVEWRLTTFKFTERKMAADIKQINIICKMFAVG